MPAIIAKLSIAAIAKLPPGDHAVAPGVYIRISGTNGRSWFYRYRVKGGKRRDIGLGSEHVVSRDDAIREADRIRLQIREGIDPVAKRREVAIDAALKTTFEKSARGYYRAQEAGWSASHKRAWLANMERYVFPVFGVLGVDKVTIKEVLAVVEPLWIEKHETGSRLRGAIEQTLDYAKAMKQRTGENPAQWKGNLSGILAKPKRVKGEKKHLAAMPWQQVPAFVAELRERDDLAAKALEFLILTTARSEEVRGAMWREIDFERRLWTIPAERMKARRTHVVPLTARALAIIEALPRRDELMFPIGSRDSMIDIVKTAGDFTVHGLRASFSSWAGARTNLPRDVVERVLAHQTGNAVEQSYRRDQEIERRAAVLAAWERFVDEGVTQDQVVVAFQAA